jgi:hypothetical protein
MERIGGLADMGEKIEVVGEVDDQLSKRCGVAKR